MFALPFALSALLLACPYGVWPPLPTVAWVVLAMVGGRTYAMGLNRLLDAKWDALNPRTANRELPSGKLSPLQAWVFTLAALALLIVAVLPLPPLCLQLLPLAVVFLTLYSYTKRFTALCHLVLGLALGSSAIGGWLALTGAWNGGLPILFGAAVMFWVAGFDIIYACQDVEFDQQQGLHSLPAWLGAAMALRLSRVFHTVSSLCLAGFGLWFSVTHYPLAWPFWLAWAGMSGLLVWQQRLVSSTDLSKANQAFFTLNGWASMGVFFLVFLLKWLQA